MSKTQKKISILCKTKDFYIKKVAKRRTKVLISQGQLVNYIKKRGTKNHD